MDKIISEVSRIDCRLCIIEPENRCYFFTLDRVNINTVKVTGITFILTKSIIIQLMDIIRGHGFDFVYYERPDKTVIYNVCSRKFVKIDKSERSI